MNTPGTDVPLPSHETIYEQSLVAAAAVPSNSAHSGSVERNKLRTPDMETSKVRLSEIHFMWKNLFYALDTSPRDLDAIHTKFMQCKRRTDQHPLLDGELFAIQNYTLDQLLTLHYYSIKLDGALPIVHSILQYLVSIGCSLENQECMSTTVFLRAARKYREQPTDFMALLIRNGADVQAMNQFGQGAIHLVLRDQMRHQKRDQMVDTWRQPGRRVSILTEKDENWLIFLLEAGCDPTPKDSEGKEPVEYIPDHDLANMWVRALTRTKHWQGLESARRILTTTSFWSDIQRDSSQISGLIEHFTARFAAIQFPEQHRPPSDTLDTSALSTSANDGISASGTSTPNINCHIPVSLYTFPFEDFASEPDTLGASHHPTAELKSPTAIHQAFIMENANGSPASRSPVNKRHTAPQQRQFSKLKKYILSKNKYRPPISPAHLQSSQTDPTATDFSKDLPTPYHSSRHPPITTWLCGKCYFPNSMACSICVHCVMQLRE
jgi:hypothetical protein